MNREIKFRIFDKKINFLYYPSQIDFGNKLFDLLDPNNLIISKYTGLKDINGIEIYEGDIVQFLNPFREVDENIYIISPVIFLDGLYKAYYIYYENNEKYTIFLNDCDKLEIIGNIYEDSFLLKEMPNIIKIKNFTSLMFENKMDKMEKFVKNLKNINEPLYSTGMNFLHKACQEGHYETVKILIDNGADINLDSSDGFGCTPLFYAKDFMNLHEEKENYEKIIYLLINHPKFENKPLFMTIESAFEILRDILKTDIKNKKNKELNNETII